jgi:hypothetical protein
VSVRNIKAAQTQQQTNSLTFLATSLIGRWKLALSSSSVRLLDWPLPRFCSDGDARRDVYRQFRVTTAGFRMARRVSTRVRPTLPGHFFTSSDYCCSFLE